MAYCLGDDDCEPVPPQRPVHLAGASPALAGHVYNVCGVGALGDGSDETVGVGRVGGGDVVVKGGGLDGLWIEQTQAGQGGKNTYPKMAPAILEIDSRWTHDLHHSITIIPDGSSGSKRFSRKEHRAGIPQTPINMRLPC